MIKAVICDDELATRNIICHFLEEEQLPIEIVGNAEDGEEAIHVQESDQQGGQGQIENGGHTDAVKPFVQCGVRAQAAAAQAYRELDAGIDEKVDTQAQKLTDAGGKGCTCNAHGRHRA